MRTGQVLEQVSEVASRKAEQRYPPFKGPRTWYKILSVVSLWGRVVAAGPRVSPAGVPRQPAGAPAAVPRQRSSLSNQPTTSHFQIPISLQTELTSSRERRSGTRWGSQPHCRTCT